MVEEPKSQGGFWQGFYSIADTFAAPIVNKFLVGEGDGYSTNEQGMIDERRRINRLNGSGPLDEQASAGSPTSFWQFLTGNRTTLSSAQNGSFMIPILLLLGIGFLVWRFARR